MKKSFLRPLLLAWLVLAMFTIQNSISAFNNKATYCSGLYCQSTRDCGSPCFCSSLDNKCYDVNSPAVD